MKSSYFMLQFSKTAQARNVSGCNVG